MGIMMPPQISKRIFCFAIFDILYYLLQNCNSFFEKSPVFATLFLNQGMTNKTFCSIFHKRSYLSCLFCEILPIGNYVFRFTLEGEGFFVVLQVQGKGMDDPVCDNSFVHGNSSFDLVFSYRQQNTAVIIP